MLHLLLGLLIILSVNITAIKPLPDGPFTYNEYLKNTQFLGAFMGTHFLNEVEDSVDSDSAFLFGFKATQFLDTRHAVDGEMAFLGENSFLAGNVLFLDYYYPNKVIPYRLLGLGLQNIDTGTDIDVRAGYGAFYAITEKLALRTEAKVHIVTTRSALDFSFLAGLNYHFYKAEKPAPTPEPEPEPVPEVIPEPVNLDKDGDLVLDPNDHCPNTPAGADVDKNGCLKSLTLQVIFPSGSTVIDERYYDGLKEYADYVKLIPGKRIEIQGHTDSVGSSQYNQFLSKKRADAIRVYLIKEFKIPSTQLIATGYGETQPKYDNSTAEGRRKNRRITAFLLDAVHENDTPVPN